MVRWLDLAEMVPFTPAKRRAAHVPARPAPKAEGAPCHVAVADADGSFMFDYVADLGDGFDPTMAVAWQLTRPELDLPTHPADEFPAPAGPLRRGSLLVFGGDQVYPWASAVVRRRRVRRRGGDRRPGARRHAHNGADAALGSTRVGERSYDDVADAQRSSLPDGVPVTVGEMLAGLTGRRPVNALSDEENARLAVTSNLDEMIGLVLRGLRTVRGG